MSEKNHHVNQSYPNYYYPPASPMYYPPAFGYRQTPPNQNQNQQYPPQYPLYAQTQQGAGNNAQGMMPMEQSYIENILRLNRGKEATVHMTFEGDNQKIFKGTVEAAGRDHLILSDPQTGRRYLLLMVYLDYITFDEEINYAYPYTSSAGQTATYPAR
ncbi:spore coat protein GerQ [Virgibacillus alimentarius]|uniref:Spore germination protein Q n=1 Tax=Virgibacillus alimentarius TaxID=698769 RepID=A0ABS4S901_9BACI|nr:MULTISPECIES: spore coat protein GerQ [Virgibacillus]MBP2257973.1 spore germination protein Q [Virgibacillus alimentarius]HLR67280.1 spore coat protein GerQ [Virgibacillus sp.]